MPEQPRKPSPEQLLRRIEAEEAHHRRGKLKIFLGYASGVGKSFRMFDEGRRRKQRGQDVVVAAVQPSPPPEVAALLQGLEIIAATGDAAHPGLNLPAILARAPAVCLIDGLAYRNRPGSAHQERWQEVELLLTTGISVITSINLQYVRERQPQVLAILGRAASASVPEAFLHQADEIEVVDAPPEYCLERVRSSSVALDAAVLQRQLSELREIALLLAAEVVEGQLDTYLKDHGLANSYGTQERILVCLTPRSNAELMLGRGRRQADRFHGELFVVTCNAHLLSPVDQPLLEKNLQLARQYCARVERLQGEDFVSTILSFCAAHGITQIFVGHSQRHGLLQRLFPNPVEELIARSQGIDLRVFPNAEAPAAAPSSAESSSSWPAN